jgi:hypothetical protein
MSVPARLPAEVRPVLALLLASVREALGEQLVGLYLYGSLSSSDFDPASSDIDFLAVTHGAIAEDDALFEQLRAMHARIAASGLPFADKLEGSYIPRAAWRRYDPAHAWHPTIGHDWPFQIAFHDANWVIERAIVRECGAVLHGPPPAMLIDPVSPEQLRGDLPAACRGLAGANLGRCLAAPTRLRGICRADALPRTLHHRAWRVLLQARGRHRGWRTLSGLAANHCMGRHP